MQAILLLFGVALILTSYYLMKTAREGLILSTHMFGLAAEELKSYAGGAMAVLLLGIVPLYGLLAKTLKRITLINVSYAIVIGCLVVFFIVGTAGVPIGLAFFIWIGVVSVFLIAQFWSYANDLYTEEQGKRLFALIAIGGSLGAVAGPQLSKLGETFTLLPVAAGLLVVTLILLNVVERIHRKTAAPDDKTADELISGDDGFLLILRDPYLLFFAALILLSQLVNTNGEFILGSVVRAHAANLVPDSLHANLVGAAHTDAIDHDRREFIKGFYATYFFWVNLVGFIIQAFFVSRILQKLGVRKAIFIMPIIAIGASSMIGAIGGIYLIRAAKVAENSVDYSLENTVRQALWLPTTRAVKYKAKAAIDTFVVRFADTISAVIVWLLFRQMGLAATDIAFVNIAAMVLALGVAAGIAKYHKKISREHDAAAKPADAPAPAVTAA